MILLRSRSKFMLFCSKWRTVFHFMTMVGADALHFCGFISSANLTCLKQRGDQDLHTVALLASRRSLVSQRLLLCFIKGDDTGSLATFEGLVP